jgi:putative hemolysin
LIFLSAFFSAAETALTSISKIKLLAMMEEKVKNADKIQKLTSNPSKMLSTILIGNNIVNICASSLATSIAIFYSPTAGVGIATVVMTIVVLIFGEITPKSFAAQHAEKLALGVVNVILFLQFVFTPIIVLLNVVTGALLRILGVKKDEKAPTVTEAELKTMVNVSHEEGVLEVEERRMINNVFNFGDAQASDVMTPRIKVVALDIESTYDEVMQVFREEKFSRLPVYTESIDKIVGVLHLKDVIFNGAAAFSVEKLMRKPFYISAQTDVAKLFEQMKEKNNPFAIVLDDYGGTAGLLTFEDLVEEIVGNLFDEYDETVVDIEEIGENEYIADGMTHLVRINEMAGTALESDTMDSISGYITELLGRFPEAGEVVENEKVVFTVLETDKTRISKVKLTVLPEEEETEEDA